ncbi:laminin G [Flavobacterium sp. ALD4]|uniref:LamG-like jellyroll fold domain-containing protein n=1 Tax=Flavobacterium sp. ALD4 TaxID=2058314 RepID=UPI000C348EEB|nr:LamG-like jellyroll fold domain-containing protein [Flavobacterium sp. ALD4]PKH66898.1 laminin G [Flavobacterium sp. ALD4]
MKKIIITLGLWFLVTGLWAQNDTGAKVVTVSQAIQKTASDGKKYSIQVGAPYLGQNFNSERNTNPLDIRFPWDVLYLYPTFTDREGSFEVSKGYFGDKVLISWSLRSNSDLITTLKLYRREYSDTPLPWSNEDDFLKNISKTDSEYEDKYVEGGVLYEYKLFAEGVNNTEELYANYITGIGFRNPTAIVTGNVSFNGGSPVKDVVIRASSDGAATNFGSALEIPSEGQVEIKGITKNITTEATFQAWLKPEAAYTDDTGDAIRLFKLESLGDSKSIDVKVKLFATSNILEVNIGGSIYKLHNYYPSGTLNDRGDEKLDAVSKFNTKFVHFSVIMRDGQVPSLFINGRKISTYFRNDTHAKLVNVDANYITPYFEIELPTQTNSLTLSDPNYKWDNVYLGGENAAILDEMRVWRIALDTVKIRTDYTRYISGNNDNLISYLSANENVGEFAYDFSRNGFIYNKNNGKLVATTWLTGTGNTPSSDQLGVLGVTDKNGNYQITSIPYSGTGESFNITPLYGQHQFEPGQQLVFLGQGSEVVNKIDFIDKSSFSFKGKVLFDSRGVFKPLAELEGQIEGDNVISDPGIKDEGYNYYEIGSEKYPKGKYWLNDNGTPYDGVDDALKDDDYLELYADIASEGVNIYIDGNIVLGENNIPVVSDEQGYFDVSVPIGNHYITLKKDGHTFVYNSRFPAETGTFKEFFEDSNEQVIFIDDTRVTVVGRVVGGSVEAAKVIGFGENGLFEKTITDTNGDPKTITISSKNNIGVADITLGYKAGGAAVIPSTKVYFPTTNSESGEYRVALLPLDYELLPNDIIISNNLANISILDGAEPFNFSEAVDVTTPKFEYDDGTFETGTPYHYAKSFTYRSTPVLKVVEQTSDKTVEIDGIKISTGGFDFPVYSQFKEYKVVLNRFERYTNYDDNSEVEDLVPVIDGELLANNNLALADSETIEVDPNDGSILTYTFKGGLPANSYPFTKESTLRYRINSDDYPVENYKDTGIILGGESDGTRTFTTEAPDIPDIILRDPPGSNSFASIEKGTSFTFTTESSFAATEGGESKLKVALGATFEIGGGLTGPVVKSKVSNNLEVGIGVSGSSKDGKSLTKTYTFSQTISTSDDPDYVGADGDLYIGNSKNQSYGSFNDIQASTVSTASFDGGAAYSLENDLGETIYLSKQKAVYFVEEPSETFFVFSQKHILTTLIPEYELFINNLENSITAEDGLPYPRDIDGYEEQIRLWKKVILDNEKSKYLAKNEREKYKATLANVISNFNREITSAINNSDDPLGESNLRAKLAESNKINNLLDQYFDDNISFDAGVAEFTRSVETSVISETSTEYNLTLDEEFTLEIGFSINDAGFLNETKGYFQQDINTSLTEEEQTTANISYTLKDNDPANLLSVDVVNSFDGNGPIFITQGGRTSCPYEGPEESKFFTEAKFAAFFAGYFDVQSRIDANQKEILELPTPTNLLLKRTLVAERTLLELDFSKDVDCCTDLAKAQLSFATQSVENILLTIEGPNDISNIPEGQNAEFVLKLENLSDIYSSNSDYNYFDLVVENTSNPLNAIINIGANGNSVYVPYGEPTYFTLTVGKSVSDEFDYEDIIVYLSSKCDPVHVYSEVEVSAHFIPACSEVTVNAPLDNWTYNRDEAYNLDGSTKPLMVNMIGFNTAFESFKKIDLEYRLATSPNWTRLHSYYGSQAFYDDAVVNAESEISLISSSSLSYSFDIAGLNLLDGDYEIRARSSCTNDTEFISEVITGRIDLHAPQKFGTPLPIDGILGAGEDLRVSFNENIFYNQAVSTIEIKGQTNQLPINHNVSLHFEGATNTTVINSPKITAGDITLEFWMNNATIAGNATIIKQEGGLNIGLNNGELFFTLGGITVQGGIANDGLFHHYTFTHKNSTGEISMYQDDVEIAGITANPSLNFTNNNPLIIGGGDFIGNIHDLRLWNKTISLENAYAKMYDKLIGNEANLIGYWPMDEGRGELAKDLARFKHAAVNSAWDIKPKGNSYEFTNGHYLALDNTGFVQLTNEMDATISFWMKTGVSQEATLFSNGKSDGSDIVQSNGLTNKWAINITSSGNLTLDSEGSSYLLTSQSVADDNWHHVTLLFNRIGSLRTYVDAAPVSSNLMTDIGGFSGNNIWLGARGSKDLAGNETVDREFTGKIDEFRLWNTLRNVEQISRDRFNEVDIESIGLVLYARMNEPDPSNGNGPSYYHAYSNQAVISSNAVLNNGTVNYSDDVPAIKPERNLIKFQVNHVINEDEMILEPVVSDWASLEGQVLDITVHRMFDNANNMQQSPITWTAYVKRNEVSWFAEGYNEIVDIVKKSGEEKSFEITVLNKGGKGQPFTISNIPSWLKLSRSSGTINPDSKIIIMATIDKELTAGEYLENMYLQTDFGYDEKLQIKLRVLAQEPNWAVDPSLYNYSMNIVGRIKVDAKFSEDSYDKVAAFYNGEVRGSVNLVYNSAYQEYFAFLTVYSNSAFGENIEFKIWDSSQGKVIVTTIDTNASVPFEENGVLGKLSLPAIFENSGLVEQKIAFNKGWTWISMNVLDANFADLNQLTNGLSLETNDRIQSHSPARLETYTSPNGWDGQISTGGGFTSTKMYKVFTTYEQSLIIKGVPVELSTWSFPIQTNWNWLPYSLLGNQPTNEALAYFDATDGDVIKSQSLFAIYDPIVGWNGTLNYLESGKGYMINSSKDQTFKYPTYLAKSGKIDAGKNANSVTDLGQETIRPEFTKYADNMNAVVSLPQGYDQLFVYDASGVLKGATVNQYVNDTALSFITVYGEISETLVFYIGDGINKKRTSKSFSFKGNDVLGTFAKPIVIEEIKDNVTIYPNPFDNEITIKVNAVEDQIVSIQLYSLTGQILLDKKQNVVSGENVLKIQPRVASGAYLLQIEINGEKIINKVMKN